ncbi:MAG: hypothetical protein Q8P67_22205 [archaeon]|nr:hypothetical protein [archaeon]
MQQAALLPITNRREKQRASSALELRHRCTRQAPQPRGGPAGDKRSTKRQRDPPGGKRMAGS